MLSRLLVLPMLSLTFTYSKITGKITISHATLTFTMTANSVLGFSSAQSGATNYTSDTCPDFGINSIALVLIYHLYLIIFQ